MSKMSKVLLDIIVNLFYDIFISWVIKNIRKPANPNKSIPNPVILVTSSNSERFGFLVSRKILSVSLIQYLINS